MLKQVYSLLSSCTACKVQAKCCVVLFINLICSDMSDYVGKKLLGGGGEEIQRCIPYLFLSNLQADEQQ